MSVIHLVSPPMHGKVVEDVQHAVNHHLKLWGVPETHRIKPDGVYGPHTRLRTLEVCYGLGISHTATARGIGPVTQRKLRNSHLLSNAERGRAAGRDAWRRRLAWRLSGGGEGKAVEFALAMAGKHIVEHPPSSNLGPFITNWERAAGYRVPPGVSWCGCFVNACLVAGGLHSSASWGIGYVPNIEAHAQAGHDGRKWLNASHTPQRGWIATFGRGLGEHTEFVVENGWPLRTVGGNTSPNNGGSFNNGGGVYYHNYAEHIGFPLRGFAVPHYV